MSQAGFRGGSDSRTICPRERTTSFDATTTEVSRGADRARCPRSAHGSHRSSLRFSRLSPRRRTPRLTATAVPATAAVRALQRPPTTPDLPTLPAVPANHQLLLENDWREDRRFR